MKMLSLQARKSKVSLTILAVILSVPLFSAHSFGSAVIEAASSKAPAKQATIFLAGDSTVSSYDDKAAPRAGWGQVIGTLLNEEAKVKNKAASGRSSKSFIDEGRLTNILGEIGKGDYLFIQFGHNDEKKDDASRFTDPDTTYKSYLKQYIDGARQKGAIPILITPVERYSFDSKGKVKDSHGKYPEAVKELGQELAVPVIDLTAKSKALFEQLGPDKTKELFLMLNPKESPNYPEGVSDKTHFQEKGALQMARLVVEGIRELKLPLLNSQAVEPPPEKPAVKAEINRQLSYRFLFGSKKEGYTTIDSGAAYQKEIGYGFGNASDLVVNETGVSASKIEFNVDTAADDYTVNVAVPADADTSKLKAFVNEVEIKKKWVKQENGSSLLQFKFAVIGGGMQFVFTGEPAAVSELAIEAMPKRAAGDYPSLFLISDSTVRKYDAIKESPVTGWGQVIGRLFAPEIKVENRANGGRSTKVAYKEGRLNDLLVDIKPGDYMFIQFAHNDEAKDYPDRYVTYDQYKDYLNNQYIRGALERGAIPVLLTSMNRRTFDKENQTFKDSFPIYTQAMKEVAAESNLVLLDLNQKSLEYYNSLGYEGTLSIFMNLYVGENPNYPKGSKDGTHFKEAGAKQMARMIVEEINSKIPALAPYTLDYHQVMKEVFSDTQAYWARDQIEKLALAGVMNGNGDGTFYPDGIVSTADFARMLSRIAGLEPSELGLQDLATLEQPINRESAAAIILDVYSFMKQIEPPSGNLEKFTDQDAIASELADKVASAVELKLLALQSDELRPQAELTRGEAAAWLYNLYVSLQLDKLPKK